MMINQTNRGPQSQVRAQRMWRTHKTYDCHLIEINMQLNFIKKFTLCHAETFKLIGVLPGWPLAFAEVEI